MRRVLSAVAVAAITVLSAACGSGSTSFSGSGTVTGSKASASATATPTGAPTNTPTTTQPPATPSTGQTSGDGRTYKETQDYIGGVQVFGSPEGAAPPNSVPQSIPYSTVVRVRCYVPNNTGTYTSVNDFYLIVGGTWDGLYAPADTFTNGEPLGSGYPQVSLDPRVSECQSS